MTTTRCFDCKITINYVLEAYHEATDGIHCVSCWWKTENKYNSYGMKGKKKMKNENYSLTLRLRIKKIYNTNIKDLENHEQRIAKIISITSLPENYINSREHDFMYELLKTDNKTYQNLITFMKRNHPTYDNIPDESRESDELMWFLEAKFRKMAKRQDGIISEEELEAKNMHCPTCTCENTSVYQMNLYEHGGLILEKDGKGIESFSTDTRNAVITSAYCMKSHFDILPDATKKVMILDWEGMGEYRYDEIDKAIIDWVIIMENQGGFDK